VFVRSSARVLEIIAVAALAFFAAARSPAQESSPGVALDRADSETLRSLSQPYGGWSLTVDNDLFGPAMSDRDYTGGVALTVSGTKTARHFWSLDPALRQMDRALLGGGRDFTRAAILYSAQVGLISFTPQEISASDVVADDRPYASLAYVTSARQYVYPDGRRVRQSALTLGLLGLSLAGDIHDGIHEAVGDPTPKGYPHQISSGGEPTLRYVLSDSKLRGQRLAFGSGLLETKTTAEMSLGFLTEASYAVSMRLGAIDSPWWSFNPERVDYIVQPSAVTRSRGNEFYFWGGAKLRLRAYNAFLQGQFRDSAHTFESSDLHHVIGEAWIGFTRELGSSTSMSYAVRYQTAEINDGVGSRDPVWAGVTITHSFL
jgi:hypothetical protein